MPSCLAAAVGAGLPAEAPRGLLVVHVGAARTEVCVLCAGEVVAARALRLGGQEADRRIVAWIRATHELLVPREVAVDLKHRATTTSGPLTVLGHVLGTGEARTVQVDADALARAADAVTAPIRDAVLAVLRDVPPELCADLLDSGLFLTGGGAAVPGLAAALRASSGLPVLPTDDPAHRVIDGLRTLWTHPPWPQRLGLPGSRR